MTIDSKKIMSKNIQHYMDIKNKTRKDVCNALGLNYATFSDWIQGRSYPRPDKVEKLAKYFGVTRSDLVDPHPTSTTTDTINTGTNNGTINSGTVNGDIIPTKRTFTSPLMHKIPVLGSIVAGIPAFAEENIIDWTEITEEMYNDGNEYFALRVKGRSMEPRLMDGDLLIVRAQDHIEDGEIGIVVINGDEATVKVVKEAPGGIMLVGDNTAVYTPTFYSRQEIESLPIRVIGKVVFMRREF